MTLPLFEVQRHADRILDVLRSGSRDATNGLVMESWSRCVEQFRLHPAEQRTPNKVSRIDLDERRARSSDVIACARYEMSTLYHQLGDPGTAVVLTDTGGVIVHMVASPELTAEAGPLGLRVGGIWSEAEAGTNGMGTCLAAGVPVSVRRDDHFYSQFAGLTCSAVPVYDPAGEIAAVLDVTSRSGLMQQHVLVLLGMTARMIENRLLDARFAGAHPLHFHSRPEFVYTLHEGRLAVGDDGRVLAANRSALLQLGLASMADIRMRRVEDLFETSLEDMLRRSHSAAFHPVVTYRAHAANRFFAVVRQPASATAVAGSAASPAAARSIAFAGTAGTAGVAGSAGAAGSAAARVAQPSLSADLAEATFADPRLVAQLEMARRVIARGTPILLRGETGSGKEVFARATHAASPRAGGAFVAVNCASLPETLIEAELFGYRAGAFTGAQRAGRSGKIRQADGGTLFLDEIADMPLDLQSRLLRVLDERQVTPLGCEESHAVEFQLVSASHQALLPLVQQGRFREDLYYRVAGVELSLPPLRERSDRRQLILGMLRREAQAETLLGAEAERMLFEYAWPGNIRQLRHVLRTAVALADGMTITPEHLPALRAEAAESARPAAAAVDTATPPLCVAEEAAVALGPIDANERRVLLELLEQQRWNVSKVAKSLGISRNTLYRKLHRLRIAVSHAS
jgi:sigma-54 dependent transcriptional regulator, acetoin dehydrogenase operon transcriptional activator AcoR